MKGFLRAGHWPTLAAALLYFDVSFMTWVILGPLAPFLREDLGLGATQLGLLTAIPLLGGSLFAPRLAERFGWPGVVGAAGGLGGFFLPSWLGGAKDLTGTYGAGLALVAAGFVVGLVVLLELGTRWSRQWEAAAVRQTGVFCYRKLVPILNGR